MKKLLCELNSINEDNEFVLNEINDFCIKKIKTDRCKKFYDELETDGIYECPYNFNCIKKGNKIYNCLLIKNKFNPSKVKMKKGVMQSIFDESKVYDFIEIDEQSENNLCKYESSYDNFSDFLHDITKVNKLIEQNSKGISKSNLTKIDKAKLESIIHLSDFIKKRINLHQYISNPALLTIGRKRERNGYQLWDIYRYIFTEIGQSSKIKVSMKTYDMDMNETNDAMTTFYATDSVTILPFLLIDNAIKYSSESSTIKVKFFQDNGILKRINICSNPSYVIMEDPNNFFERGYRSANNPSKSSGSGLGLNIVKQICDYNEIKIGLKIGPDETGKQEFIVDMIFTEEEI